MEEVEKDSGRDMTPKLIGETYMRYPTEKSKYRYKYGLYECQYCNKEFEAITSNIKIKNISKEILFFLLMFKTLLQKQKKIF